MSEGKAREFWIAKGESNFADELKDWVDGDEDPKHECDFYDLISAEDTIQGGLHVIEYSAVTELEEKVKEIEAELEEMRIHCDAKDDHCVELEGENLGVIKDFMHIKDVERITGNMVAFWKRMGWDSAGIQAMEMLKESIKDVVENQQDEPTENNHTMKGDVPERT